MNDVYIMISGELPIEFVYSRFKKTEGIIDDSETRPMEMVHIRTFDFKRRIFVLY